MKLKSFILPLLLISSIACAAGPTAPKIPSKAAPFFHREVVIDLSEGFSEAKKLALGCSRVTLILPFIYSSQGRELDFKKVLDLLPKTMMSLKIKGEVPPLPVPPLFFKGLEKFHLLRHLSLPISYAEGKRIDLTRLPLTSLQVTGSSKVLLPLSLALENLTLEEERGSACISGIVKRLKKASRLPNLKSLKYKYKFYRSKSLSCEDFTGVLASLTKGLNRRAPACRRIDSLDFYLEHISFIPFERFFENNRSLKRLSLEGLRPPFSSSPPIKCETEEENKKALLVLLRNLESLSLTNYENLGRLFQGVEKLEDLTIRHLAFKEKEFIHVSVMPEDIKGIFSAFQAKLESLTLDSHCRVGTSLFPQIITEKNYEEIENIKELHFHTLNLNISTDDYDKGLQHFLKVVFDKAPLKTFSLKMRSDGLHRKDEKWVFNTLLPGYKGSHPFKAFSTLKTLELRGAFHDEALQQLFKNKDGQGILGNTNLERLSFAEPHKDGPKTLRALLEGAVSQDASKDVQEKIAALPEEGAIKVLRTELHIPDRIKISFTPYEK